jgi:dolichyl-phosphate beta-glucosyltransferase
MSKSINENSVSLVIPAFNEAERIKPFLSSIVDHLEQHSGSILEVLVVDDGSSDDTVDVTNSFAGKIPVRVLVHSVNQGKGAAVQTGVKAAVGDIVIFMDADGATPITELENMTKALADADIAIGNRWLPGSKTERHSLLRQLSGLVYRKYMSLFGLGKIDTMCGFKGYKKEVANDLFANLIEKRWLFDTEVAYKAVRGNYSITNFPISWESKDGSKLDTVTLIKSALQIWPLIRKINRTK